MDTVRKDSEFIPSLIYGIDKMYKPRPLLVDLQGHLIVAGLVPTTPTALEPVGAGLAGGGISAKIETVIYPQAAHNGVATFYSSEFVSNAHYLAVYVNLLAVPGAVNFTPTVQVRHKSSPIWIDLITFGAIAGVVGLYRLDTPIIDFRYRMSFVLAAGAWIWAAYVVESF